MTALLIAAMALPALAQLARPLDLESLDGLQKSRSTLSRAQWEKLKAATEAHYTKLLNDPFLSPRLRQEHLERWLEAQLKTPLPPMGAESENRISQEDYWRIAQDSYQAYQEEMEELRQRHVATRPLLEEVYIYEQQLYIEGATRMDDAFIRVTLHNGQEQPLTQLQFIIDLSIPHPGGLIEERRTRHIPVKPQLNPWETRSIDIPIMSLIPEDFHLKSEKFRRTIKAEATLHNFSSPQEGWMVTHFPEYMMRRMESSEMRLAVAESALESLEPTGTQEHD